MDSSEVDSGPTKVHDEDYLAVSIPQTAHQISKGVMPVLFDFFSFIWVVCFYFHYPISFWRFFPRND